MAMSRRQIIMLVLAGLIALGTILMARSMLKTPEPVEQAEQIPQIQVLVAARNVAAGKMLANADVTWRNWPAETPTDGLITKTGSTEQDYVGAVVRSGFKTGEPIHTNRIMRKNDRGFLAAVLSPGMRAMTIRLNPQSGVAGLIFPNDRVDVILSQSLAESADDATRRRVSETVLENVRVLALDQKTDDQKLEPKLAELATLEVTPKQAEKLALVTEMGTLSLVLRSVGDAAEQIPPVTTMPIDATTLDVIKQKLPSTVTGGPVPAANTITWDSDVSTALPSPPAGGLQDKKVIIYRGGNTSDVTFRDRP